MVWLREALVVGNKPQVSQVNSPYHDVMPHETLLADVGLPSGTAATNTCCK